ncbi:hypothetical protein L3X38_044439 [Prunus dulcis]|uniref:Ionotropic glutamate receptor C-terminal domain-containing protein n=1 Tax=Prunus dulcis TaxID=3755 RepID=A0AAD4YNX2_PRUDU|nr:hypothetical protein L3X38_044439 [Prunus dulcis]
MESGYVWIATAWLSTVVDSTSPLSSKTANSIQGVLTLRPHTPDSERKRAFISRWNKLSNGSIGLNSYGLYAYDTVWMLAHAINLLLDQGGTISFSNITSLGDPKGGGTVNLVALSILHGGKQFPDNMLQTNTTGLTGPIAFHPDRSPLNPAYDLINIIESGYQRIGYWSKYSGISVVPPETSSNRSTLKQQLTQCCKPWRDNSQASNGTDIVEGYCIDIFLAAIKLLPYAVPYEFVLFGDGLKNPSYYEFVNMIASGIRRLNSRAWEFLKPFGPLMWGVTAAFFLIIGLVVWILEHRINDEFSRPPRKQIVKILWFSFSTMFFAHGENTVSTLGRTVLIIWLFIVLIINSSYTASLTSMLTVQLLQSPITGIDTLETSTEPVGYQIGSFAQNYLVEELNIPRSRLVSLGLPESRADALKKRSVAAVVDEKAYIELFLS